MAKKIELNLPTADSLFSTQEERDNANLEKVLDVPLTEIDPFPDHPFQVNNDEFMQALVESVKEFGIQTPCVVRQKEDGRYELISGHRRHMACELAEKETLPCIVRQMSRDEAIISMVDSNLQREIILPSEKAKSYKMKLDAIRRNQGERTDLTSAPVGQKLEINSSRKILSENSPDSSSQIQRFIRLNELIPQLLDMVDTGKMAMRPAVELSYLPEDHQEMLLSAIEAEQSTPSHVQTIKIRKFSEDGNLNEGVLLSIMQEKKPNQTEHFKIPRERISKYFPVGTPTKNMEDIIVRALAQYRERERNRNDSR